jgi:aspartate/methionine/tyrosine aminotransferase
VHVPAFPPLFTIPRHLGCDVTPWRADPDRGWQLDLNALTDAICERTRLIVVSFPHNPTGYVPSAAELRELVAVARDRGIHLLCDEVYRAIQVSAAIAPLPSVADVYDKGISIGGVSKVFGVPGARIGWAVSRDLASFAEPSKTRAAANVLGLVIANSVLANRAAILQRNNDILRHNVALFRRFLDEHAAHLRCDGPMAGPVVFPRLVGHAHSADDFCEELLRQTSTLAVPGSALEFDDAYLRIGLGRRSFSAGLDRLAELLRAGLTA